MTKQEIIDTLNMLGFYMFSIEEDDKPLFMITPIKEQPPQEKEKGK